MPYLLDADTASLALRENKRVQGRMRRSPDVWLSAIAAEEMLTGVLALLNANRDKPGTLFNYGLLINLLSFLGGMRIYPYDEKAVLLYQSFPASVKRIGPQDCRIAASAIAAGWIVVTANTRHFSQIPGVQFEDWSL